MGKKRGEVSKIALEIRLTSRKKKRMGKEKRKGRKEESRSLPSLR